MTATRKSLLLDPRSWDLVLDGYGNIATAPAPYSLAQTAANALRTFLGEPWYATDAGVPYWEAILGRPASLPVVQAKLQEAAMTVEGVVAASVALSALTDRTLTGIVYVTDRAGQSASAAFSVGT